MSDLIPLFPLHMVLFPEGPLPLRIFEPRYLDMISRCLRQDKGFGVCLIREGQEVGEAATTYEVGTLARITDWHARHDGLLGVTVVGEQRFRVVTEEVRPDQLIMATVELLPPEPVTELPAEYAHLAELVKQIINKVRHRYDDRPMRFDDASWVGCRLAELFPLQLAQKQYFLQLSDPIQRLERLALVLENLEIQC